MIKLFYFLSLFLVSHLSVANVPATSFLYEEKEEGTEPVRVRYLVSKQFMRIDNGGLKDDFILFDRNNKIIYSINHADKSVLVIPSSSWTKPEFSFSIKETEKILEDAPKLQEKKVLDYSKSVNQKICHRIQIVPGVYGEEMQAFIEYQYALSGQQVKILNTTPVELQTPCFLVDQVYNAGDYYLKGLPVQEWHSRGYIKSLLDYKQRTVGEEWFVIPEQFKRYSLSTQ